MRDDQHLLRDPAELEGALFVSAEPIDASEADDSLIVQSAVGIPDYQHHDQGCSAPDEQRPAREGTMKGRKDARAEIASIQRTNRDASYHVKLERQRVQEANAKAKTVDFATPPIVEMPLPVTTKPPSNPPSHKPRKKGYEIAEYKLAEYDTAAYDTTEYKSMYDS